jgi:hypothetical protein
MAVPFAEVAADSLAADALPGLAERVAGAVKALARG